MTEGYASQLSDGQEIGPYRLLAKIGEGGMGVVWKALDTRLERPVALKMLRKAESADSLASLEREAKLLAALNHPGIVTLYTVEDIDNLLFLTMEFVDGEMLERLIPPLGLSLERFMDLALPLVEAVEAAHARGVIHRDLKASNILVDSRGRVKVLDFGLAKLRPPQPTSAEESSSGSQPGLIQGTLYAMAPELLRGKRANARSDIFALGVLFYEMLSGRPPFEGQTAGDLIAAILTAEPNPLSELRADLPGGLIDLVHACLEKEAAGRPEDVARIRQRLVSLVGEAIGEEQPARARAIAVLPLENLSGDPADEYITDGMTEALITDLARLGGLRVISRTSIMRYKGVHRDLGEVARELKVEAVVEGSVLCVQGRVRISARLIRSQGEELLWADRFDRDLQQVLEVQSEVAQAIVGEIEARLGRGRRQVAPPARQMDPEVFQLNLRGRHELTRRTEDGFRNAIRHFHAATRIDPMFAPCLEGLAEGYLMLVNYGLIPIAEGVPPARSALDRALELDPDSADAYRALAQLRWNVEFDWPAARQAYEQSLRLDPNSAATHYWYGAFLGVWGRFEEGFVELHRALELDPLSLIVRTVIGWTHYFARQFEQALPYYDAALNIEPDFLLGRWFRGQALIELGRYPEGLADLEAAHEISRRSSRMLAYLGYGYGRAGRQEKAGETLRELEQRSRRGYVPPYFMALVHCGLGDASAALDQLDRAVTLPDSMVRDLKVDPPLDLLRPEPRFQSLLARIGLA